MSCHICQEEYKQCERKENILYNCFSGCSLVQCKKCILEWLKLKDQKISYQCPQCRQNVQYESIEETTDENGNERFSEWCRNDPEIVDKIYKKYENYKYSFSSLSNYTTTEEIVEDMSNINRRIISSTFMFPEIRTSEMFFTGT
ncbi:MAG: hypothetical protein R3321_09960 [Nitrososphaeraceae archaeon]|nr:hypothetical protein [Nitrososphaeraceae archaeon]